MQIRIEKMTTKHIDDVLEIEKASFPSPWTKTMFFQETGQEYSDCFVLMMNEEVVAYLSAWIVLDECTLNKITCRADLRRRGYGTMILKHLIQVVFEKGIKDLFIEVRESNHKAVAFYDKSGFVKTGVRKGYYSDTNEDAVLMSLNLEKYLEAG